MTKAKILDAAIREIDKLTQVYALHVSVARLNLTPLHCRQKVLTSSITEMRTTNARLMANAGLSVPPIQVCDTKACLLLVSFRICPRSQRQPRTFPT